MIAELGKEEKLDDQNHEGNTKKLGPDQTRDNFGIEDEDWDIYRDI
jgi:hypothetical protein